MGGGGRGGGTCGGACGRVAGLDNNSIIASGSVDSLLADASIIEVEFEDCRSRACVTDVDKQDRRRPALDDDLITVSTGGVVSLRRDQLIHLIRDLICTDGAPPACIMACIA